MNARRLTLIRRAYNAIEEAMRRRQFSNPLALYYFRETRTFLRKAKRYTIGGNAFLAKEALAIANAHMARAMTAAGVA